MEVTYYFNSRSTGNWTDPDNMINGELGNYASTASTGTTETLDGNTCPETPLGTVTNVELRVYGHGDGDDEIIIDPTIGSTRTFVMPASPNWTAFQSIGVMIWSLLFGLGCNVQFNKSGKGNTMYCAKVEIRVTYTPPAPPTVTTQAVTHIGWTSAVGNGDIVETFENCTKRGVCWNTTGNPTIVDDKAEEIGSFGEGPFEIVMPGLAAGEHYYVKAYAENSEGYGYGSEVEFDTGTPPVSDIDVGADPKDRLIIMGGSFTMINKNNPANASGILHTVKIWAITNLTAVTVGTFYTTNGNTLKCRDSEAIGDVEAGAERTITELSITVEAGDYIGAYWANAGEYLERDLTGCVGLWTFEGERIDPNDEEEYNFSEGDAVSLYGYGDVEVAVAIPRHPVVNFQDPGIV